MKKILLTLGLMALTAIITPSAYAQGTGCNPIQLVLENPEIDPEKDMGRSIVLVPSLYQDGHTLYFLDEMGYFVNLYSVDVNGVRTLEYTTFVSATTEHIVLPSTLIGVFDIEVVQGDLHFWGEIEL